MILAITIPQEAFVWPGKQGTVIREIKFEASVDRSSAVVADDKVPLVVAFSSKTNDEEQGN